jgi:hypothetical protein
MRISMSINAHLYDECCSAAAIEARQAEAYAR